MFIKVFQGEHDTSWYWHIKAGNGRVIADNEAFPSKANAKRAACNVVRSIIKQYTSIGVQPVVMFGEHPQKDGSLKITWV